MTQTLGGLLTEARSLLNDTGPTVGGLQRYSDADLIGCFNDALHQARAKRPDLFLGMGLRNAVPLYAMPGDADTPFPLDPMVYPAFIYYIVGRSELREDTFTNDGRAIQCMQRFIAQLMAVAA